MREGWNNVRLGDICETGSGGTPLKAHKDFYEGGTIPWLQSGEVSQGNVFESHNFITEKGLKNSSARMFPIDTVLVAMYGATAGQVGILRFPACTNQAVCGILPNNKTIPEFIFYCFLSKKDELVAQAVGGAQPNISQIKIKNTFIPLPPLTEQNRIVAILDEVFDSITRAKDIAARNLRNARELFESYLSETFANFGEGTSVRKLFEVVDFKGGGTPSTKIKKYWDGKIPWISSKDMKTKEISDSIDHVSVEAIRGSSTSLIPIGSVLIVVRSGILAHTVPIAITLQQVTINQDLKALIPKKTLDVKFLYYHLCALQKKMLALAGRGATVHRLPFESLKNIEICLPTLPIQKSITHKLDTFLEEVTKLEAIYQQKLTELVELKKSVLQKAFNGELTS